MVRVNPGIERLQALIEHKRIELTGKPSNQVNEQVGGRRETPGMADRLNHQNRIRYKEEYRPQRLDSLPGTEGRFQDQVQKVSKNSEVSSLAEISPTLLSPIRKQNSISVEISKTRVSGEEHLGRLIDLYA